MDPDTGEEFIVLNTERQTKTRTGIDPKILGMMLAIIYPNPRIKICPWLTNP